MLSYWYSEDDRTAPAHGYDSYWTNLDERPTIRLMILVLRSGGHTPTFIRGFLEGWRRAKAEHARLKRLMPPASPTTGKQGVGKSGRKQAGKRPAAAKAPGRSSPGRTKGKRESGERGRGKPGAETRKRKALRHEEAPNPCQAARATTSQEARAQKVLSQAVELLDLPETGMARKVVLEVLHRTVAAGFTDALLPGRNLAKEKGWGINATYEALEEALAQGFLTVQWVDGMRAFRLRGIEPFIQAWGLREAVRPLSAPPPETR